MSVSVAEAKAKLSELIEAVQNGETVVITKRGKVVAELRAPEQERARKPFDFDALRRFQQTLPMSEQSAVDLVRQMRDESRY
jgi:prevent-host-death family protein